MITMRHIELFKQIAPTFINLVPGGISFFTSNLETFTWKLNSDVFDFKANNAGDQIGANTATAQTIRERREVSTDIPRSVYGMRVHVTSTPIFDDEGKEIVGVFSTVLPRLHPIAAAFNNFAPVIAEMFPEGAFLYMTDLEKIRL